MYKKMFFIAVVFMAAMTFMGGQADASCPGWFPYCSDVIHGTTIDIDTFKYLKNLDNCDQDDILGNCPFSEIRPLPWALPDTNGSLAVDPSCFVIDLETQTWTINPNCVTEVGVLWNNPNDNREPPSYDPNYYEWSSNVIVQAAQFLSDECIHNGHCVNDYIVSWGLCEQTRKQWTCEETGEFFGFLSIGYPFGFACYNDTVPSANNQDCCVQTDRKGYCKKGYVDNSVDTRKACDSTARDSNGKCVGLLAGTINGAVPGDKTGDLDESLTGDLSGHPHILLSYVKLFRETNADGTISYSYDQNYCNVAGYAGGSFNWYSLCGPF